MTPRIFLDLICRPHVEAFAADPTSSHKEWAAVVALGQFVDYLAAGRGAISRQEVQATRRGLEAAIPQLGLISDVANVNKHVRLDGQKRRRAGLSIHHIGEGKAAAFSDGSFFSDGSSFAEHRDVIRTDFQGEHLDLVHLCTSCLAVLDAIA
jgi:hypothetical protein